MISPLLANCYLYLPDHIWQLHGYSEKLQARLVRYVTLRYADDFVVLCRSETDAAITVVRQVLEWLDLTLNDRKSRTVDARQDAFTFLGFSLGMRRNRFSGKNYPHVEPSAKSLQAVKSKIGDLTARNRTAKPRPEIVKEVKQVLVGWKGYFRYRNSPRVLGKLCYHVKDRMRTHLGERFARFPSRTYYTQLGLYKVPTNIAWKTAHALV